MAEEETLLTCDSSLCPPRELFNGQPRNCGAEMCLGRIPKCLHKRVILEHAMNDRALSPNTSSVDQTYLPEARLCGGEDVFFDHRGDVAGGEGVKVKRSIDGNTVCHF